MTARVRPYRAKAMFQQAYVVNDLRESVERWSALFGAGPFALREHHTTASVKYHGELMVPDVSYAFGYLGEQMIQFIVQHDDTPSIYRDMFAPGEEGFHHIAYLVSDVAAEKAHWTRLGYPPACEVDTGSVEAAYFDTRDQLGVFTEIHGDPPRIIGLFANWKHAHELWQPGDSPFLEM